MSDVLDLLGQLVMVDFAGLAPSREVERLIAEEGVGGVVLFAKNVADPQQVARLTNALQDLAASSGRPPLLISTDQEGGAVSRLRERATCFPSAMAFGATRSEALVAAAAGITARELRAVGVHMNLAPVLDVNTNPQNPVIGRRSFGDDPRLVARLGAAAIRAMQAAGVAATAKHFPGHGDTALDSHLQLPTVHQMRHRLEAVELVPFRAAIQAGVAAVMTAHVIFPALDPDCPATVSHRIIGLLREDLGFPGVVVTDSLAMRGITDLLSPEDAAVRAVQAGADMVLACGPYDVQLRILQALREAVRSGRVPASRVVDASSRVLALKRRLGLTASACTDVGAVPSRVGIPSHRAVLRHVAEAAVTVVRDPHLVIPLPPGPVSISAAADHDATAGAVAAALRDAGRMVAEIPFSRLDGRPEGPLCLVEGGEGPPRGDGLRRLQEAVLVGGRRGPVVVLATGSPYALVGVPEDVSCLALYDEAPALLEAAAGVLTGSLRPRGVLPVTLSQPHDPAV